MSFRQDDFLDDIANSEMSTLDDYKADPKATLAGYGLTITDEQSAFLKLATTAGEAVPDLEIIPAVIEPR